MITGSSNLLLKLATVASSVLFMAAFVAYHAGAFDWLRDSGRQIFDLENVPMVETLETQPPATSNPPRPKTTERKRAILPGSKSDAGITGSIVLSEQ